jgi:hypothetical protein
LRLEEARENLGVAGESERNACSSEQQGHLHEKKSSIIRDTRILPDEFL